MNRPLLNEVPLARVWPIRAGACYCTMSPGQWDTLLLASYNLGFVLLELDADEVPVRAFCKDGFHHDS